jgi:hypothetical protein
MLHFMIGLGILVLILSLPIGRLVVFGGLIIGAIGLLILLSSSSSHRQAAWQPSEPLEPARPLAVIKLGELSFRDLAPNPDSLRNNNWVQLTGVLTNDSPYPLKNITFDITVEDCSPTQCMTVGRKETVAGVEQKLATYNENGLYIPSKQTHAITSGYAWFEGLPSVAEGSYRKLTWLLTAAHPVPGTVATADATAETKPIGKVTGNGTLIVISKVAAASSTPAAIPSPPASPSPTPAASPPVTSLTLPWEEQRPVNPAFAPPPVTPPQLTAAPLPQLAPPIDLLPKPPDSDSAADSLNAGERKALLAQHPEWKQTPK